MLSSTNGEISLIQDHIQMHSLLDYRLVNGGNTY